jgi:hypothetical protein
MKEIRDRNPDEVPQALKERGKSLVLRPFATLRSSSAT